MEHGDISPFISRPISSDSLNKASSIKYDLPQEIGYYSYSQSFGQKMDQSMLKIYDSSIVEKQLLAVSTKPCLLTDRGIAILKPYERAEYLDLLLNALQYWADQSQSTRAMIQQSNVITWRGLISKLAQTRYISESVSFRVCIFKKCLYIMEHKPTVHRSFLHPEVQKGCYIGRKFETIITKDVRGDASPIVNEYDAYVSI